jgi:hypothetical protein
MYMFVFKEPVICTCKMCGEKFEYLTGKNNKKRNYCDDCVKERTKDSHKKSYAKTKLEPKQIVKILNACPDCLSGNIRIFAGFTWECLACGHVWYNK